ncbi:hypothetical protein PHYBLDRAFT_170090 [Phycomyces blakesleeanus NRRL 1555(-)]|uniref:Uncharacterized protein n=1 Tax=Phycomyces blakesleeanus (strain ATCC 8743b / DSM 1359 / FGSC 10004 / NBRC 33097 / NRRL 1555) TaxID=763407 RepID=A0A167M9G3_PHYB8|nr:hypothetical protein PHYBLDRAFT_170090 [Phycomyces blakesleeanus NRRL 1555(-)]OAD72194.1 hypothetical protein PHYBLDRAFT_170090 [Phycomyces blakesleeanus NRRL 1555(-)]|eukprot:XP_018290234.1 hypothetical protein PHYBLDRAFT_170090 [Phycomyces blakesleeanus NRRL 1555(-)]
MIFDIGQYILLPQFRNVNTKKNTGEDFCEMILKGFWGIYVVNIWCKRVLWHWPLGVTQNASFLDLKKHNQKAKSKSNKRVMSTEHQRDQRDHQAPPIMQYRNNHIFNHRGSQSPQSSNNDNESQDKMNDYMDLNTDEAEAGSILIALANHSSHSGGYAENYKIRSVYNHTQKIKQEEQPQIYNEISVSGNSMSIRNLLGDEDRKPLALTSNFEREENDKHRMIMSPALPVHQGMADDSYNNAMRDDSDRVQSTHRYRPTTPAYMDVAQHNSRAADGNRVALDYHGPTSEYHRNLENNNSQYPQDMRGTVVNGRTMQPPPPPTQQQQQQQHISSIHQYSTWQTGSTDQYSRPPKVHTNRRASVPCVKRVKRVSAYASIRACEFTHHLTLMQPNARVEPSNGYSQQFVNMRQNPRARRNALHAYISYMTYTDLSRRRPKAHKQQAVEMASSYPSGFQPTFGYNAPAQDPQNRQSWHAYSQQSNGPKQTVVHAAEKVI